MIHSVLFKSAVVQGHKSPGTQLSPFKKGEFGFVSLAITLYFSVDLQSKGSPIMEQGQNRLQTVMAISTEMGLGKRGEREVISNSLSSALDDVQPREFFQTPIWVEIVDVWQMLKSRCFFHKSFSAKSWRWVQVDFLLTE
jgi:hypothetical protein